MIERTRASAAGRGGCRAAAGLMIAALFLPTTGDAGTIIREVQLTEPRPPAPSVRLVRQVLSEGDDCKILHEESTDALAPAGTYVLANASDAFFVDPSRETIAPVDPTRMMPALPEGEPPAATISGVTLERVLDEPGPTLLGLPTRHYVYRLRYDLLRAGDAGAPVAVRHEERHEFHATPWGATLPSPRTWRAWRVAEDAGLGAERRELRDAIDSLHEHGLMLRHAIERRMGAGEPEATPTERITREVTSLSVQKIEARVFVKPEGFTPAEFLAPVPEDGAEPTPADPGGAPAPGGAMAGGG